MSVLDSFGGGNVWSLGELEFTSSINDILEKENFTLDELLREPELLQEVKSKNENLSADSVITELLTYISVDASNDDDDYRKYKYPYMSCEIICFEIPSVLDKIVDTQDERYLKLLFDPILQNRKLNNYLAGYFEKMLESELTIAIDIPISSRKPYIGHLLILALVLDNLIGTTTPYKLDIDVESLETTEKVNEPTAKSSFREYFEDILDLQTWDTFSVEVLNKLSVAATQSINTEILDSPVLELGANSRFLKQSDSLELGFDAFDEGNDNDWNDELNYPYGNSTNVYTNTNNSHYDDLKEFKKDFAKPNMFETDWNANFHDTSIDDFATFASFPAQSGTATFPDPCGTETFPASRYEAPGVQINKDNKVIDFDDPFSYSNDDLKIDDLVNEDK
eukprot:gene18578-24304_t